MKIERDSLSSKIVKSLIIIMFVVMITIYEYRHKFSEYEPRNMRKTDSLTSHIDETNRDYISLLKADYFAYGDVGYGGDIPEWVRSFERLNKNKNALEYFILLEKKANNQGKLYALCGLYYHDYKYYRDILKSYLTNEKKVNCMTGCIRTTKSIMYEILNYTDEKGRHDLINNLSKNAITMDELPEDIYSSDSMDFIGEGIPREMYNYIKREFN